MHPTGIGRAQAAVTAATADWNTASDWSINAAPNSTTYDVLISQPGVFIVSIAAGETCRLSWRVRAP
jgi:hypothetical protein